MTTPTHDPCCSSHNAAMDCDTYRRTHFVEVGDCCEAWQDPYRGFVPRGCPAGFSADCPSWTSTGPCRCLESAATAVPRTTDPTAPREPK